MEQMKIKIPARERWIFENPEILAKIKQGLADSAKGNVVDLGDFSKYINSEDGK